MMVSPVTTKALPQTHKRALKILFTTEVVKSLGVQNVVPTGCIMATPTEIALKWKTSSVFRSAFDQLLHGVWTNQIGLNSLGYHRINNDGSHTPITREEFEGLKPKDRSLHTPGNDRVVMCGIKGSLGGLGLRADQENMVLIDRHVAYIQLEDSALKIKSVLRE
jgi:hypothetical protein